MQELKRYEIYPTSEQVNLLGNTCMSLPVFDYGYYVAPEPFDTEKFSIRYGYAVWEIQKLNLFF